MLFFHQCVCLVLYWSSFFQIFLDFWELHTSSSEIWSHWFPIYLSQLPNVLNNEILFYLHILFAFCFLCVHLVLPVCTWVLDHSLKHGKLTSGHMLKERLFLPLIESVLNSFSVRGLESFYSVYAGILVTLMVYRSWAGNQRWCEFMIAIATPCPAHSLSQHSSLSCRFYILSASSSTMFAES